jgi:hypothetical protein
MRSNNLTHRDALEKFGSELRIKKLTPVHAAVKKLNTLKQNTMLYCIDMLY